MNDYDDFIIEDVEEEEDTDDILAHLEVSEDMDDPDINKLYFSCPIKGLREEVIFKIYDHCDGWGCFDTVHQIEHQCNTAIDKILNDGHTSGYVFIKISYFDGEIEDQVEKVIRFFVEIDDGLEIKVGDRLRCLDDLGTITKITLNKGSIITVAAVEEDEGFGGGIKIKIQGDSTNEDSWISIELFEKVMPIKDNAKDFLDSIADEL